MRCRDLLVVVFYLGLWGCAGSSSSLIRGDARQEVMAAERAFAKTMSDRNHAAFATFVADEAVFFSGPKPLHGRQQIVEWWVRFYAGPNPPFSWDPEQVEVLGSGNLALSSGPVLDPHGKVIARFTAYFRPSRTAFQTDRGRCFRLIADGISV